MCVTNDHGYVPFVVITIRSYPCSWLITGFVIKEAWRVPHVEAGTAEPSGVPKFTDGFQWSSCCSIFSFCRLLFAFLSFFDLQLQVTPLVSSNSSCKPKSYITRTSVTELSESLYLLYISGRYHEWNDKMKFRVSMDLKLFLLCVTIRTSRQV